MQHSLRQTGAKAPDPRPASVDPEAKVDSGALPTPAQRSRGAGGEGPARAAQRPAGKRASCARASGPDGSSASHTGGGPVRAGPAGRRVGRRRPGPGPPPGVSPSTRPSHWPVRVTGPSESLARPSHWPVVVVVAAAAGRVCVCGRCSTSRCTATTGAISPVIIIIIIIIIINIIVIFVLSAVLDHADGDHWRGSAVRVGPAGPRAQLFPQPHTPLHTHAQSSAGMPHSRRASPSRQESPSRRGPTGRGGGLVSLVVLGAG